MTRYARTLAACLAAGVLAFSARPALATETTVISGDDPHLYIVVKREPVTRLMGDLGKGKVGFFQGDEISTYIAKGKIPISTTRFYELMDEAGAAPTFMSRIHEKHASERFWGWSALGGYGLGVLCIATAAGLGRNGTPLAAIGSVLGLGGLVSSVVWLAIASQPDFEWEAANDAITDYNKRLDAKR